MSQQFWPVNIDGNMGILAGFDPSGRPFILRPWRTHGWLEPETQTWGNVHGLKELHGLIRANTEFHRRSGMKSYEKLIEKPEYQNKTWIILGAGPSLYHEAVKNLSAFDYNRDDVVVVGINRSLIGMVPDIYFCMDRHCDPIWWEDLEKIEQDKRPILVTCPSADHRLLGLRWKDMYHFKNVSNPDMSEEVQRLGWLESLQIAMCSAIDMAARANANKIIVLGSDCAFDDQGRKYFDSEPTPPQVLEGQKFVPVTGINGHVCWINKSYYNQAAILKGVMTTVQFETGIPCYNASERGILNHNNMPLLEALKEPGRAVEEQTDGSDVRPTEDVLQGSRI